MGEGSYIGFSMLKPPSLTGKASRACSVSPNSPFPVMEGKMWYLMASSRDWKKEQSVFVVRIRCFHLLESPCVKAEYAACGIWHSWKVV